MKVLVHVKDKCIPVSVGNGDQPVRWLAEAGLAKYKNHTLGAPRAVRVEDGSTLPLQRRACE